MAKIVMKFGGTSVADLDRIRHVASLVKREVERGNQVAVVVSAMAGETNKLVLDNERRAELVAAASDAREYDVVVAAGEQVTAGLTAVALSPSGSVRGPGWAGRCRSGPRPCMARPASKGRCRTDDRFLQAAPDQ